MIEGTFEREINGETLKKIYEGKIEEILKYLKYFTVEKKSEAQRPFRKIAGTKVIVPQLMEEDKVKKFAEIIEDAKVIPGLDTLFLGEIKRINKFEKRCNLCGDCIQNLFDGLCPISRCPKNMLNGPCGGSINGKCEVSKDLDCIWENIIEKLDKDKKLFLLKKIVEPKKWSKSLVMQR